MTPCQYFPFLAPQTQGTLCAMPDVCKGTLCARGKTVKQGESSAQTVKTEDGSVSLFNQKQQIVKLVVFDYNRINNAIFYVTEKVFHIPTAFPDLLRYVF